MKMLVAALTLSLSASAAFAQAPCEHPVTAPCEKACAVMGAKFALSMRQDTSAVHLTSLGPADVPDGARRLAELAGLPLAQIDLMTLRDAGAAVARYCPQPRHRD